MAIELQLVQMPETIDEIDATFLESFLDHVVSIRVHTDESVESWDNAAGSILRYIKNRDRWLAWTSLLLKSQLYRELNKCTNSVIVDLPRTEYNKPFVPPEFDSFSVSHQWPFVGIAHDIDGTRKIGFDIVMFDPPNEQLYHSTLEFVEVFRDQFSTFEWDIILEIHSTDGDDALLREFYIRWAVKEAYTKALGLGMHVDFSSFTTQFHSKGEEERSLWQRLRYQGASDSIALVGTITHASNGVAFKASNPSLWNFVFVHLSNQEKEDCLGYGVVCAEALGEECPVRIQRAFTANSLIKALEAPESKYL